MYIFSTIYCNAKPLEIWDSLDWKTTTYIRDYVIGELDQLCLKIMPKVQMYLYNYERQIEAI